MWAFQCSDTNSPNGTTLPSKKYPLYIQWSIANFHPHPLTPQRILMSGATESTKPQDCVLPFSTETITPVFGRFCKIHRLLSAICKIAEMVSGLFAGISRNWIPPRGAACQHPCQTSAAHQPGTLCLPTVSRPPPLPQPQWVAAIATGLVGSLPVEYVFERSSLPATLLSKLYNHRSGEPP